MNVPFTCKHKRKDKRVCLKTLLQSEKMKYPISRWLVAATFSFLKQKIRMTQGQYESILCFKARAIVI